MATRLEKKSAELMLKKLQAKLDMLFQQQDTDPQIPKQKKEQGLPKHFGGYEVDPPYQLGLDPTGGMTKDGFFYEAEPGRIDQNNNEWDAYEQNYNAPPFSIARPMNYDPSKSSVGSPYYQMPPNFNTRIDGSTGAAQYAQPPSSGAMPSRASFGIPERSNTVQQPIGSGSSGYGGVASATAKANQSSALSGYTGGSYTPDAGPIPKISGDALGTSIAGGATPTGANAGNFNWGNAAMTALQAAPALYNAGKYAFGKRETIDPKSFYNKNNSRISQLMRDRRVNVDPMLEANTASQNTLGANLRDSGAISGGNYRTNMIAANLGGSRNKAAILADKSNRDLGYMGEDAQMAYNQGRDMTGIDMQVSDWNTRTDAAYNNYGSAAASNLGQFAANQQMMKNQKIADQERLQILGVYNPYAAQYFSKAYNRT